MSEGINRDKIHTNITYRRAELSDAKYIYVIEQECFAMPWSFSDIEHELSKPNTIYVVAEDLDSGVCGFAGLYYVLDEAHITNVAVEPSFRGRKIGTEIIRKLLEFATDFGIVDIMLEVRVSNLTAIKLYENFGFRIFGVRKGYYLDNGEDAYIMIKRKKDEDNSI